MMVAALFVSPEGSYANLPGVDAWDAARDARRYAGPHPVVAHPPCQRWGKLWAGQPLHIKRTGHRKTKGDDGGCFAAALASVRKWGGVLEHPWGSHAWPHFGLAVPPRAGELAFKGGGKDNTHRIGTQRRLNLAQRVEGCRLGLRQRLVLQLELDLVHLHFVHQPQHVEFAHWRSRQAPRQQVLGASAQGPRIMA